MARLFITPREIDLINDIAKEVIRDVIGQKVYYFSISREKTRIHDVYDESVDKIFDNPLELPVLVDRQASAPVAGLFGTEQVRTINVYVQARDLLDNDVEIKEGDFISYGAEFYEIVKAVTTRSIYGQVEYNDGIEMVCREARQDNFIAKILGPTEESYTDADATQETFVQTRGASDNSQGLTGDVRALQERGVLEAPLTGPKEVSPRGDSHGKSSFYDE